MNIMILATPGYSTERIEQACARRGHTFKTIDPLDCDLTISSNAKGFDALHVDGQRLYAKDFNVCISRSGAGTRYGLSVLEHLENNLGIPCTNRADAVRVAANKFACAQRLSQEKIKQPKTIFSKRPASIDSIIARLGGLPVIVKILSGSQGKGVAILESPLAANTVLESFFHLEEDMILQEYIGKSRDIRAWVIDGEYQCAMERLEIKNDFRKNASLGAEVQSIELTDQEIDMAIKAASATGLGVAGVDILRDQDDQPYCLEVNSSPSLKKISTTTDIDLAEKIVEYAERIAKPARSSGSQSGETSTALERIFGKRILVASWHTFK